MSSVVSNTVDDETVPVEDATSDVVEVIEPPKRRRSRATSSTRAGRRKIAAESSETPAPPADVETRNVAGFPVAPWIPDKLKGQVGNPVPGHDGYFVRVPFATYRIAAKVGDGAGSKWLVLCEHGSSCPAERFSAPASKPELDSAERVASRRAEWCDSCAAVATYRIAAKEARGSSSTYDVEALKGRLAAAGIDAKTPAERELRTWDVLVNNVSVEMTSRDVHFFLMGVER